MIKILFNAEEAFITNESRLEDFINQERSSLEEIRERLCEQIAEAYGVVVPEILSGETYLWKVVELIDEKQRKKLFPSSSIKKALH